jgi:hypothetical protein
MKSTQHSRRRAVIVLSIAVLASCGRPSAVSQPTKVLSQPEVRWLASYQQAVNHIARLGTATICQRLSLLDDSAPTRRLRTLAVRRLKNCASREPIAVLTGPLVPLELLRIGAQLPADGPSSASHVDSTLSNAASATAGFWTEVRCWSPSDWNRINLEMNAELGLPLSSYERAGFVWYANRHVIQVPNSICAAVRALNGAPTLVSIGTRLKFFSKVAALKLLGHELEHVLGGNEHSARCLAEVRARQLAMSLHVATRTVVSNLSYLGRAEAEKYNCRSRP